MQNFTCSILKKKAGFATIFVLTIQKLVRGHLGRVELNRRKLLRSATIRATAVVIIQSLGRGYVARSRTQKVVQEKEKSVGSVNFLLLRWIGRHRRRKHRAKKVMGRLSIRLWKIKAKMTHMVHAARAHVENTEQGSDLLTRVARGYLGRCKVRARKRDLAKRFWAAQQIQKIIRATSARLRSQSSSKSRRETSTPLHTSSDCGASAWPCERRGAG